MVGPGWIVDARDGLARIRGLPAGAARLHVDAPGRGVRDVRVLLREGQPRTVRVRPRRVDDPAPEVIVCPLDSPDRH